MGKDFSGIKTQKFGIEVECTGLTRAEAAEAIAAVFATEPRHFGGAYDKYGAWDSKGRLWTIVSDSSIECTYRDGEPADSFFAVELVSPILEYEDIPLLQDVVRAIRKHGGICNESTGIHIHIDFEPYDAQKLRNLVNIFASKSDMLYKALQVEEWRENEYCKKLEERFIRELNRRKPKDMETVKKLWYGDNYDHSSHYDSSRYCVLNIHSVFQNNNFEVRAFNSSLHAGVIRAYISLVLAISNQALTQKSANPKVMISDNPRYTFRTWLIRMGLNGDEFKNCRTHLLKHLEGNIAWRHPEDAIAQRERLKQKRLAEKESRVSPVSNEREIFGKVPTEENEAAVSDSDSDLSESSEIEESMAVMTM